MRFKRFTKPGFLKEIGREMLGRFFAPFLPELARANIQLPAAELEDDDYFKALSRVAMAPDGLPDDMIEALYAVEGTSNPEGQERLELAKEQGLLELEFDKDSTHGEISM